jgi:hypothetical protein
MVSCIYNQKNEKWHSEITCLVALFLQPNLNMILQLFWVSWAFCYYDWLKIRHLVMRDRLQLACTSSYVVIHSLWRLLWARFYHQDVEAYLILQNAQMLSIQLNIQTKHTHLCQYHPGDIIVHTSTSLIPLWVVLSIYGIICFSHLILAKRLRSNVIWFSSSKLSQLYC